MYTHDELDQMNKDPLSRAAHELLDHAQQCAGQIQQTRRTSFIWGMLAALLGVLVARLASEVGVGDVIWFLFWILVAAAAVYGVLRFWSENRHRFNEKSSQVRTSISDRLSAYGEKLNKQESRKRNSDQTTARPRLRDRVLQGLEGNPTRTQGGDGNDS